MCHGAPVFAMVWKMLCTSSDFLQHQNLSLLKSSNIIASFEAAQSRSGAIRDLCGAGLPKKKTTDPSSSLSEEEPLASLSTAEAG